VLEWPYHLDAEHWPIWNKFSKLQPEVKQWLDVHAGEEAWDYHEIFGVLGFQCEADAIHFKLRWC
jgi:hypothetical protein